MADQPAAPTRLDAAVTVLELLQGIRLLSPGRRRTELVAELDRVMDEHIALPDTGDQPIGSVDGRILAFDNAAARATATVAAERRRAGRPGELRDSMIAGIALSTGASLATHNTRHSADFAITRIDPRAA
jgi:predicted nucleic acid-binding protein